MVCYCRTCVAWPHKGFPTFMYVYLSHSTTKPAKWPMYTVKTQISLGIHPALSESLLCAFWVAKDPVLLHADREDSYQTGWMPRLIWVLPGCTGHFIGFVVLLLICLDSHQRPPQKSSSELQCSWCSYLLFRFFKPYRRNAYNLDLCPSRCNSTEGMLMILTFDLDLCPSRWDIWGGRCFFKLG